MGREGQPGKPLFRAIPLKTVAGESNRKRVAVAVCDLVIQIINSRSANDIRWGGGSCGPGGSWLPLPSLSLGGQAPFPALLCH